MRTVKWLGCLLLGVGLSAPVQAETIKIGILIPYSGTNADLGDVQDKAFDLYMKLHAKDIAPHKVELIKRDEGPPSGANAKTAATELITRDKVNLILGVVSCLPGSAMARVIPQATVLFILAKAGPGWTPQLSPYIVLFSLSMWHEGYERALSAKTNQK